MTHFTVIENKISSIKKYLKILQQFNKYSKTTIQHDIIIRGSLERYLYLAIQSTIDLAEAIISYKQYRKPSTFSEAFDILYEEHIITKTLTTKLIHMTGFRNIMAHDYEQIDYDIVYNVLHKNITDIKKFITKTAKIR